MDIFNREHYFWKFAKITFSFVLWGKKFLDGVLKTDSYASRVTFLGNHITFFSDFDRTIFGRVVKLQLSCPEKHFGMKLLDRSYWTFPNFHIHSYIFREGEKIVFGYESKLSATLSNVYSVFQGNILALTLFPRKLNIAIVFFVFEQKQQSGLRSYKWFLCTQRKNVE